MENTTISVPNTQTNANYYIYIISLVILIMGVCIYKNKKK